MKILSKAGPCIVVLAALTALPGFAVGKDARAVYKEGVSAFKEGRYEDAARLFKDAYEAKPTWKLLYNIGQSEAAAKRYGHALTAFEEYLAQGGDDLAEDRRAEVLKEVERLRKMVGYLKIKAPDGATVQVNGDERGTAPLPQEIPLGIGRTHVVQVSLGQEDLGKQEVKIYGGKTIELSFVEENEPVVEPREEEPDVIEPSVVEPVEEDNKLKTAGWITLAAGGAILLGGAVTGGVAYSKDKDLEGSCEGGVCPSSKSGEVDKMNALGVSADVMFAVGGVAAATGIVLLIVSAKKEKAADDAGTEVSVAPAVAPGFSGLSLTGRF